MYVTTLYLDTALFLFFAIVIAWGSGSATQIRWLRLNAVSLSLIPLLGWIKGGDIALLAVFVAVAIVRVFAIPTLLARIAPPRQVRQISTQMVNSTSTLLVVGVVVMIAYVATRSMVEMAPNAETRALPIPFAVVLIAVYLLVIRKKAASQVVGFFLLDNGISAVAFLSTLGVPVIVEFGALLDVLLVSIVLVMLTGHLRGDESAKDLDDMRELYE